MNFKDKLSELVRTHKQSPNINIQKLESDFITLIAETLSAPPLTEESINKINKVLYLQFHPDKASSYSPDVEWLEKTLSEDQNNGACFKIITLCKERLINSPKNHEDSYEGVHSVQDLKKAFEKQRTMASSRIQIDLYDSLIAFLDEYIRYDNRVEAINYKKLKLAMKFLPTYCSNSLIIVFSAEIFAIYMLSALSTALGYSVQKFGGENYHELGEGMVNIGCKGFSNTTVALIRMYEMSFWFFGNSYDLALQTGSTVMKAIAPPETDYFFHAFRSDAVEQVLQPFKNYLQKNEQQYFREVRLGSEKRQAVLKLLISARNFDNQNHSDATKLAHIQVLVDNLASQPKINTSKLATAVKESYRLLNEHYLKADPSSTLAIYPKSVRPEERA